VTELIEAIEKQETVRLVYRAPRQKRPHERTLDPHHLHLQAGAIYVIGYVTSTRSCGRTSWTGS